jgi:hypothetical protein
VKRKKMISVCEENKHTNTGKSLIDDIQRIPQILFKCSPITIKHGTNCSSIWALFQKVEASKELIW